MDYIEEYRELTEEVRHRGEENATVQSILITGSVLLVANRPEASTILLAIALVLSAFAMAYTTVKLDKIFLKRIKQLEREIPIEKGHKDIITCEIRKTWWWKIRHIVWDFIFFCLLLYYSWMLFRTSGFLDLFTGLGVVLISIALVVVMILEHNP